MSLEIWGDFGMVGSDYSAANPFQDRQCAINYYPEVSPVKGSKTAAALLTCPGLIQLAAAPGGGAPGFTQSMTAWPQPSAVTNLPVRALWVLPGRLTALAVIGNTCYLVTATAQGSRTQVGAITLTQVGTLTSNTGPVVIRDSGKLGGVAVIVDGSASGYYYVYNALGAGGNVGPNGTFVQINDSAFLGATNVCFIDGWWVFNQPNSQTFYTNAAPYSTKFAGSYFANKDASSDLLMATFENKEQLWLPGEYTTEIWYDAGGQYFPFQRLVGTELQIGCKAPYSISRLSTAGQDSMIWFGRSERGENVIVRSRGLNYEVVSTYAVADAISSYPVTNDAVGYVYQEDGHEFYVLSFPTADRTWVYDASMPLELAWHQRLSYDPYAALMHRHRSNCFMNFAGMKIVGDYQNGALYQMTRAVQNDAGWPMLRRRRAPYVWDKETRERAHMSVLQVEFAQGVGQSAGLGANPQAYLTMSRDNGASLGSPYGQIPTDSQPAPLCQIGNNMNRTMWRRLGWARQAVAQLDVIAPVNSDIVGATIRAFGQ